MGSTVPLPGPSRSRRGREVPPAVINRLPEYLRVLDEAFEAGEHTLSSAALAARLDGSSARVRKDLSHLGFAGTRGVGYDVAALRYQMADVLGTGVGRGVVLVGVGQLGRALAAYPGFPERNLPIIAAFDIDEEVIGAKVGPAGEVAVSGLDRLEGVVAATGARMAILTVPATAAQAVAARLVACGVVSILNFAPVALDLPAHVQVRRSDLSAELQILAFHDRSDGSAGTVREVLAR